MRAGRSATDTRSTKLGEREMTSRQWTIREARAGDICALNRLFNTVFGYQRDDDYFRWKFFDNPSGRAFITVAEHREQIVGQYALWPTDLRLGKEIVKGAQSLDTMTHPDYRGQGMFPALAEECMTAARSEGVEALYGFPNESSFRGFVEKLDWDCTGVVPLWVRPLRIGNHKSIPNYLKNAASLTARILPIGRAKNHDVHDSIPSLAEFALLHTETQDASHCSVERDFEVARWRFSESSGMRYQWLSARRNGTLEAVGVWGIDPRSGNASLSELLCRTSAAAEAVISHAVRRALECGCPLMLATSTRTDLSPSLRRCGFIRRPRGVPLIVRKLTPRTLGLNVHTHRNWKVFGSDVDTF